MKQPQVDVLCHAEDPGAFNFLADLPGALSESGLRVAMLVGPSAARSARGKGGYPVVDPSTDPISILDLYRPRLLVVGTTDNVDSLGLHLVEAARKRELPTIGVVDSALHADRLFRGRTVDPFAFAPEWLIVPDEWSVARFVEHGFPTDRVRVAGNPLYDQVVNVEAIFAKADREERRRALFPDASPDDKVVVFLCEPTIRLRPELSRRSPRYSLVGRGLSDLRNEIVLEEVIDSLRRVDVDHHLVLRLHPKNTPEEFDPYASEVDQLSHGTDPHELVYFADLVIGMTTMLLLEAALLGRPALSVLPRPEEKEWLINVRTGDTPHATTREELETWVRRLISMDKVDPPTTGIVRGAIPRLTNFVHERIAGPVTSLR